MADATERSDRDQIAYLVDRCVALEAQRDRLLRHLRAVERLDDLRLEDADEAMSEQFGAAMVAWIAARRDLVSHGDVSG